MISPFNGCSTVSISVSYTHLDVYKRQILSGLGGRSSARGRPSDGLAHLDRAIAGIDEPGVGFFLPKIYRLRGECLLALSRDNKDDARSLFTTARDIARRQGAAIAQSRIEARLPELVNIRVGR